MKNCSIPWGAHTITYKEFLLDGEAYLAKTIRNCDSLVCFAIHYTKDDRLVIFDESMITVNNDLYNESDDEKYIAKLKESLYKYLSKKTNTSVDELVSLYG